MPNTGSKLAFRTLRSLLELVQEALVVAGEQANFRDSMAQHGDTVQTETECKAGVLFAIDTAVLEHVGVHGAAATDFHPAGALAATATFATAEYAAHVHFSGRFREGEEAGAETGLDAFAKELVHEHLEDALQVCKGNVFVYHQTFALLEHGSVGGVVINTEHVARSNHAERRLVGFHVVNLGTAGVGTKHHLVVHVEGVLHVAGRVVGRSVQCFEVVPVRFDVAAEVHFKAHLAEEVDDFFADVVQRVSRTGGDTCTGKAHVDAAAGEFLLEGRFVCGGDGLLDFFGDSHLKFVDELAESRLFFGRKSTHLLHQVGNETLLAQVLHAEVVDGFLIGKVRLCKFCIKGLFYIINSFTHSAGKVRKIWLVGTEDMDNDGFVFAVFGLVDGEGSGGIVAELFANAFAAYVGKGILQNSVLVPIAPGAVTFVFLF